MRPVDIVFYRVANCLQGHDATRKYIIDTLESLDGYYKVTTQDFPVVMSHVYESRLVIGDVVSKSARPMGLTPPTKNNQPVFGRVTLAKNNGCSPSDYASDVKGSIVLIERGGCAFADKSIQAGKAGAVTAVIYNTDDGELNGSLSEATDDMVATFGIDGKEGQQFVEQFKRSTSPLDGITYVDSEVNKFSTTNIIAQTVNGDADNCVMLGGHSDSVGAGPGINDDGSGSLTTLEIAVQLSKFRVNNCVRLAWWSAEEEGLWGSSFYAKSLSPEENQKVRLFMDYDMLASPNFAYQIYNSTNDNNPEGSEELRDLYIKFYKDNGLKYTFIPFDGRSDYVGFLRSGIPSGGIATGAEGIKTKEEEKMFGGKAGDWYDPAYHQLEDDVGNLNLTAWEVNSKVCFFLFTRNLNSHANQSPQLVAHSVGTYARSFKHYPKRIASASAASKQEFKYRGGSLIM